MAFERSLEIERRLDTTLRLIQTGRFSTPRLAETIGVSIPTVSRIVAALRDRGHEIHAERTSKGWRYVTGRAEGIRSNREATSTEAGVQA